LLPVVVLILGHESNDIRAIEPSDSAI
jgi:hypothetical protein